MHQTVIGLETKKQLEKADDEADVVVGCIGRGSNFAGFSFPFVADKLTGRNRKRRIVAIEPSACPSLTRGVYASISAATASSISPPTRRISRASCRTTNTPAEKVQEALRHLPQVNG